jgi:P-type conjugative transfer protein TrbJ
METTPYVYRWTRRKPSRFPLFCSVECGCATGIVLAAICINSTCHDRSCLQAARALQQINNQIAQLENQTQSLINQAKHLVSLPYSLVSTITGQIDRNAGRCW